MATKTVAPSGASKEESKEYRDYSSRLSYKLFELAYQAQAARSLMYEHADAERSDELTGVSYMLSRLTKECKKLSEEVSNTQFLYSSKSEARR